MSDALIIPFQPLLPQVLPTIEGNVDYRDFRDQLLRMDSLLVASGLEARLLATELERWLGQRENASPRAQQKHLLHSHRALRCNLARILLMEDFRGFAARLADSPLLQHFCGISQLERITVPSKSTLQRYDQWWSEAEVRPLIYQLLNQGATAPQTLQLPEPLDLESAFLDSTCLSTNIHYPVDWVLLRDATRTLMKAVKLIRREGLKHRMEAPESFISRINKLSIQMTHGWNKAEGKKSRKKTLRQMDRLVGVVREHARRYRDLLDKEWNKTSWTRLQTEQVLGRMDRILEQLPRARHQARERILKGRPVENKEKILSLYEGDVHVIVRGKAGAEAEFGNTLLLAENPQGLIIDWEFFRESAPSDSALLARSVGRMEKAYGKKLKAVGADRGFDSQTNQAGLARDGIYNGVCPRCPKELQERNASWKFKRLQRRRAQTEGRIAILKNAFLGGKIRSKGFAHRELTLTWTLLVHNLWVLARLQKAGEQTQALERAA